MTTLPVGASGGGDASGGAAIAVDTSWAPATNWQHLLTKPITIEHVADAAADGYGNATKTIASVDQVLGYLEPISEAIHLLSADTLVTTHQVILPPGVALTADDTVVVDGVSYRVIEALHVSNARTGVDHHIEARVLEIEG